MVLAAAAAAWLAPLDPAALAAMAVVTLPPVLRSAMARIGGSPRLSEALRASSDPVALCRVSGYVIEMNPAFERVAGHVATMEAALAGFVECDTGTIYRLSRSAVRVGFALEQVKEIAGGARWYLSVVRTGDGWLTWRVLSAASLGGVRLPVPDDPLESASFVHLRLSAEGAVRGNRRCRELFGPDPEALVAQLRFADGTLSLGERVLVCADGTERGFRIVAPARRDGAAGLSDDRELFLFDVTEAAVSAWSAEGSELADLPVAVMHLGRDGRIDWLNTAALRLLGERAMPGRMLAEFLTARGRRLEALIELAQASATNQSETVFSTGGEKSGRPLQLTLAPGSRFGSNRLFGVLSDATELHALQDKYAQSQKMEAVGQLAGGVAHDFNNLITAINGHCDLLLIGKDATQPEYPDLMQIRQNANRAAALVRQLLAFSRKQTLNPETLSISDVISDTLYLLDRLIGDRVKLRLDPDPGGPVGQVRADHRQLEQALMNLVVNARDAMPAGGTVTISTRRRLFRVDETRRQGVIPAGDYVELAVADEGTGLNDVMIDKV
ncbi:MAG: PAS domain-containing protein, partial [Pseudomonadota bacterium]